ncbi:uncharacterized protein [Palaemon carinicauda]|uniref:uncharacterized protein n=1 Tax=Palaemon carinicauda TaxID=392227 RepID=UPI0035B57DC1
MISEGKEHNHAPIAGRNDVLQCIDEVKGLAKSKTATPAAIVQETRQKIDISYAVEMPSTSAIRQAIHRIRKKEFPVEANSATDLVIPNKLKVTHTGERNFLLYDKKTESETLIAEFEEEEVQERILAFGSENNLRRLAESDIWFLDGTFKTCPKQFYQIYTIHYIFQGQILPVVYVLLPGKTTQIYSSMLKHLLSVAGAKGIQLTPRFILIDFELSCIKALQEKFPEARITGCFFHLWQSIYRSIQKYGLVDVYKNNCDLALGLRQLAALAFLRPDDIHDAYLCLANNIPDEAEPVYKYFGERYVLGWRIISRRGRPRQNQLRHPPRFHPTFWSIHHLQERNLPRTNNGVEAWPRRFETVVERYHLVVYSMIREFVKEDHRTDQEMQRLTSGIKPSKKKKRRNPKRNKADNSFK